MKGKKQKEPVGFNPAEIFAALALLEQERGIPQSFMMEKIVQALITAYKRDHNEVENVIVDVDETHKDLRMYVQKAVVDEEDYVDPGNEITLADAKHISAKYEIGAWCTTSSTPSSMRSSPVWSPVWTPGTTMCSCASAPARTPTRSC